MTTTLITTADVGRPGINDWLLAHDLVPNNTAVGLTVVDDEVTADVFLLDEGGKKYLGADGRPAVRTVTVPLRAPLPAGVGTQLP